MKKLVLSTLFFAVFAVASQAQSGSLFLMGNLEVSTSKYESGSKETNFGFNPYVGYQFNDNWTAGILLDMGFSRYKTSLSNEVFKESYTGGGIFGRYSIPLSDRFSFFGQGEVAFGSENEDESKSTYSWVDIYPGVQMHIQNGWALNFSFGGIHFNSWKDEGASNARTSLGLSLGEAFKFGFSKNIGLQ